MHNYQQHIKQFLQSHVVPVPSEYGVRIEPYEPSQGETYWRCIGVHHLTPEENRGGRYLFADHIDEQGNVLRGGHQRLVVSNVEKQFDKGIGEAGTNEPIYDGRHWCKMRGLSDVIHDIHYKHADEHGPNGEVWNSWGHHSFYVVFQRTTAGVPAAEEPTEHPIPVGPHISINASVDPRLAEQIARVKDEINILEAMLG